LVKLILSIKNLYQKKMRSTNDGVASSPFSDQAHVTVVRIGNQGLSNNDHKKQDTIIDTIKENPTKEESIIVVLPIPEEVVTRPISTSDISESNDHARKERLTRSLPKDNTMEDGEEPIESKNGLWVSLGILGAAGIGLTAAAVYATRPKKETFRRLEIDQSYAAELIREDILDFENPGLRSGKVNIKE
jgi:hypothetical protein